ncbi:hypothetical protein LSH36_37g10041 [Paralvinella palmiformis]|uniref:Interferon regulatory factor-3 domain-containing protein n=1 Tax=Paralvinella palmiformis TaxID=53620 RepID=A0AAD9NDV0_9ANNE|nr:hypothetical protein LSH36_37g10041 [Paralvinella palmiformis]
MTFVASDDNHDVHYPSDLKSLPSGDLLAVPSATKDLTSVIEEQVYPSDPNTGAPETMVMVTTQPNCTLTEMTPISMVAITEAEMLAMGCVASKPIFSTFIPDETSDRSMSDMPLLGTGTAMEYHCTVSEIHIQLKYQNRVIKDKLIDGQQGCLITSDTERQQQRVVLFYPPKGQPETRQENQIMSLLPFMKDGVWITSRNGSIFAKRSCKCGVFHVSATGTNGSPEKLKRSDKEEMIFDFEGSFLPALEHCKQFGGVAPDPCVHLIFGQTCQLNQLNKNILISATITSQKAQECLQPPKASATRCGQKHLSV